MNEHLGCSRPDACSCDCLGCKRAWVTAGKPISSGVRIDVHDEDRVIDAYNACRKDRDRACEEAASLRSQLAEVTRERDEALAHIAKLTELLDGVRPCSDSCDLGAVLAWVDPEDRERCRALRSSVLLNLEARVSRLRAVLRAPNEKETLLALAALQSGDLEDV